MNRQPVKPRPVVAVYANRMGPGPRNVHRDHWSRLYRGCAPFIHPSSFIIHHSPSRRGFTLLETLITTLLSAFLLATLWAVFGSYVQMFEVGQARAVRSQVMRGLLQQISDDLHAAIQDTAPGAVGIAGKAGRFSLSGTAHQLQFDILLPTVAPTTPSAAASDTDEPIPAAQAYELRTVRYTFQEQPAADEQPSEDVRPGLLRTEVDFQPQPETPDASGNVPDDTSGNTSSDASASSTGSTDGSDAASADNMAVLGAPLSASQNSTIYLPEIAGLEFRYFDGATWVDTWDTNQRRSLPAAVEIVVQMTPPDEPRRLPQQLNQGDGENVDILNMPDDTAQTPAGLMCRILVDLPMSALHAGNGRAVRAEGDMLPQELPLGVADDVDPDALLGAPDMNDMPDDFAPGLPLGPSPGQSPYGGSTRGGAR